MKIFINIGGYDGEVCAKMLNPEFKFDRVICIEPMKNECELIKNKYVDSRLEVYPFGLWNETCQKKLYSANGHSASIFRGRVGGRSENDKALQLCDFIKASDFFKEHISKDDYVIVKINCEGAEYEIINDLLDTGEYDKIHGIMIHFDSNGFIKLKERPRKLKDRLNLMGYNNYMDKKYYYRPVEKSPGRQQRLINKWQDWLMGGKQ
jgi:FkbM family methyltransferase